MYELHSDICHTLRRQGLQLAPLLERHIDRSPFSTPLFNAIIHHYPDTLRSLAANGLELTPEISAQHLLLSPEALQGDGRPAGREFVRAPRPGETESISLLECAASTGNLGAVKMLLSKGVLACCLSFMFEAKSQTSTHQGAATYTAAAISKSHSWSKFSPT